MTSDINRYLTVKQIPEHYPAFTESSIRWLIFNKNTNGFAKCVRKIGRKIIIDTNDFEQWIYEQWIYQQQGDKK